MEKEPFFSFFMGVAFLSQALNSPTRCTVLADFAAAFGSENVTVHSG
jgi:hypothetical protein